MRLSLSGVALATVCAIGCGSSAQGEYPAVDRDAGVASDAEVGPTADATVASPDASSVVGRACVPGQSVACVGPGGCSTNQVCASDGSGFGPCVCSGTSDAAPVLCVPGASVGCVGSGGCVANQICKADGSGYGPCGCAGDGAPSLACVPGQSIACAGPDGCSSFQVCRSDGSGYASCNCPDAGAPDASDASVWTPAQLPGLVLWLDDTYGVVMDPVHTGFVIRWRDRSGNGNDATLPGGPNGPVSAWEGYWIDPQTINGLDAIASPSIGGKPGISIADSPSLDWATGDFAILLVKEGLESAGDCCGGFSGFMWTQGNLSLRQYNQGSMEHLTLALGTQSISETPSSKRPFQILAARGQGTLSLQDDGQVVTETAPAADLGTGGISLAPNVSGELAEVIAVKGTLSDADLASAVAYLKAKFGL